MEEQQAYAALARVAPTAPDDAARFFLTAISPEYFQRTREPVNSLRMSASFVPELLHLGYLSFPAVEESLHGAPREASGYTRKLYADGHETELHYKRELEKTPPDGVAVVFPFVGTLQATVRGVDLSCTPDVLMLEEGAAPCRENLINLEVKSTASNSTFLCAPLAQHVLQVIIQNAVLNCKGARLVYIHRETKQRRMFTVPRAPAVEEMLIRAAHLEREIMLARLSTRASRTAARERAFALVRQVVPTASIKK